MKNYDESVEKNLLEMVKNKEESDKRLLNAEILMGILSILPLFVSIIIIIALPMEEWLQTVIVLTSMIPFLIAVPFVLLFKIIYDSKENSFKNALKSNIFYVSISSILLILGIILNFYFVGNLSSAPYLINLDFNYIIKSTSNIINLLYVKIYLFELLLFLLVILLGFVLTRGKEIKKYSIYIFITFLFLMSQLIFLGLTPNNSIQFRYLFPAFLAPVLLLSSLFEYFKSENKRIFYMLIGFVICSTYFNLKFFSFNELKENTNRNIIFNGYLSESRRQLNKDDNILLIGHAVNSMEYFESVTRYYNYYGYKNIYVFPYIESDYGSLNSFQKNLYDYLISRFNNMWLKDMDNKAKVIIICDYYLKNKETYKNETEINFENYKKISDEESNTDFYILKN